MHLKKIWAGICLFPHFKKEYVLTLSSKSKDDLLLTFLLREQFLLYKKY